MIFNAVGYQYPQSEKYKKNAPQGNDDYLLILLKCNAIFTLNGNNVHASPNSIIIYKKNTPQFYQGANENYINDYIRFEMSEEEEKEFAQLDIPFDTIMHFDDVAQISNIIKSMQMEILSTGMYKNEICTLYTNIIFRKISEKLKKQRDLSTSVHYDKICEIRSIIYSKPSKDYTVEQLASKIPLSKSRFQHLYKSFFGVSVTQDVINSCVEHSKVILAGTNYTIASIAHHLGYKDQVQFIRQFKAIMNMTPTDYRKKFKVNASSQFYQMTLRPYTTEKVQPKCD